METFLAEYRERRVEGRSERDKMADWVSEPELYTRHKRREEEEEEEKERGEEVFRIPELPCGEVLVLNLLSSWGDDRCIGLTGIEVFTASGERADVMAVSYLVFCREWEGGKEGGRERIKGGREGKEEGGRRRKKPVSGKVLPAEAMTGRFWREREREKREGGTCTCTCTYTCGMVIISQIAYIRTCTCISLSLSQWLVEGIWCAGFWNLCDDYSGLHSRSMPILQTCALSQVTMTTHEWWPTSWMESTARRMICTCG